MYKCENCGEEFYEFEKTGSEYRGECWGVDSYEDTYGCPYCGHSEAEESSYCEWCSNEHFNSGRLCNECLEQIHDKMKEFTDLDDNDLKKIYRDLHKMLKERS